MFFALEFESLATLLIQCILREPELGDASKFELSAQDVYVYRGWEMFADAANKKTWFNWRRCLTETTHKNAQFTAINILNSQKRRPSKNDAQVRSNTLMRTGVGLQKYQNEPYIFFYMKKLGNLFQNGSLDFHIVDVHWTSSHGRPKCSQM